MNALVPRQTRRKLAQYAACWIECLSPRALTLIRDGFDFPLVNAMVAEVEYQRPKGRVYHKLSPMKDLRCAWIDYLSDPR